MFHPIQNGLTDSGTSNDQYSDSNDSETHHLFPGVYSTMHKRGVYIDPSQMSSFKIEPLRDVKNEIISSGNLVFQPIQQVLAEKQKTPVLRRLAFFCAYSSVN